MMATTPTSVTTSATTAKSPLVKASLTASTSLSTRVISRPTGVRSKKPASSRSRCSNKRARRSWMTRWPVSAIRKASIRRRPYSAPRTAAYTTATAVRPVQSACRM